MKTLKLKTDYGAYKIALCKDTYETTDNLYVGLLCKEGKYYEPYGDLTVNLHKLPENQAYIDTNNNGVEIIDWLIENKLGKFTGQYGYSGFCAYPLFEFDMDESSKYLIEE